MCKFSERTRVPGHMLPLSRTEVDRYIEVHESHLSVIELFIRYKLIFRLRPSWRRRCFSTLNDGSDGRFFFFTRLMSCGKQI